MTENVWIALIVGLTAAIPPTVAALVGMRKIHTTFNSKMDKFLALTKTAAHAEGVKEEKEKHPPL